MYKALKIKQIKKSKSTCTMEIFVIPLQCNREREQHQPKGGVKVERLT